MRFFITVFFILQGMLAYAQSSHEAAKEMLREASERLKQHTSIDIRFTYTFENNRVDPPVVRAEKGEVQVKGEAYHLVLMGTEQICDGEMVYTILHEDEEVQKAPAKNEGEDEAAFHPLQILDLYKKNFSYKLGGEEKVGGKTVQYIILVPQASELLQRIVVGLYKEDKRLYSYKQLGVDGTETTFVVDSYTVDKPLPATYFTFDPKRYPDYYIPR